MIRELVQNDHLPDYQVALEDDTVIFRKRMNWQAPKGWYGITTFCRCGVANVRHRRSTDAKLLDVMMFQLLAVVTL